MLPHDPAYAFLIFHAHLAGFVPCSYLLVMCCLICCICETIVIVRSVSLHVATILLTVCFLTSASLKRGGSPAL